MADQVPDQWLIFIFSSMPNFASVVNSHNKKMLNENITKPTSASCNCRVKASFPLESNCVQSSLVYICKAATPKVTIDYPTTPV